MAIIKPSERYTTHKIGSSSDPTKPIGADDLVIVESADSDKYPDGDDRVRVASAIDLVSDVLGMEGVNLYRADMYTEEAGFVYQAAEGTINTAKVAQGLRTGYIPVEVGKTYALWLNKYPNADAPLPPPFFAYGGNVIFKFITYNGSTYTYYANGYNVNSISGGLVPNVAYFESNTVAVFTVPPGVTHVATAIQDSGFYYPNISTFRSNIQLELGAKSSFTDWRYRQIPFSKIAVEDEQIPFSKIAVEDEQIPFSKIAVEDEQIPFSKIAVEDEQIPFSKIAVEDGLLPSKEEIYRQYVLTWLAAPTGSNFTYDSYSNLCSALAVFPNKETAEVSSTVSQGVLQKVVFRLAHIIVTVEFNYSESRLVGTTVATEEIPVYDSDTELYLTTIRSLPGGDISNEKAAAIDAFVVALKTEGIWEKVDKMHLLAWDSIERSAINMVNPVNSVLDSGLGSLSYHATYKPTVWEFGKGMLRSANSLGHVDTTFNPFAKGSTYEYKYGLGSAFAAVYYPQRIVSTENMVAFGDADVNRLVIQPYKTETSIGLACQGDNLSTLYTTPRLGFFGLSRVNNTSYSVRRNGLEELVTSDQATTLAKNIFLFGYGTASYNMIGDPLSFCAMGGGLTVGELGQLKKLEDAVNALMVALSVRE